MLETSATKDQRVKALWRRGMAKSHIGNYEEAKEDFMIGLQLDPVNTELKKEVQLQN